jgi:hypothetical protein
LVLLGQNLAFQGRDSRKSLQPEERLTVTLRYNRASLYFSLNPLLIIALFKEDEIIQIIFGDLTFLLNEFCEIVDGICCWTWK